MKKTFRKFFSVAVGLSVLAMAIWLLALLWPLLVALVAAVVFERVVELQALVSFDEHCAAYGHPGFLSGLWSWFLYGSVTLIAYFAVTRWVASRW